MICARFNHVPHTHALLSAEHLQEIKPQRIPLPLLPSTYRSPELILYWLQNDSPQLLHWNVFKVPCAKSNQSVPTKNYAYQLKQFLSVSMNTNLDLLAYRVLWPVVQVQCIFRCRPSTSHLRARFLLHSRQSFNTYTVQLDYANENKVAIIRIQFSIVCQPAVALFFHET